MSTIIIQKISKIMIPFIQLFGLYIIVHGPVSPGGGFQGGVIIGTSIILMVLIYGLPETQKAITHKLLNLMDSGGGMVYIMVGILGILAGGKFLEYLIIPAPFSLSPTDVSLAMVIIIGIAIGVHMVALVASLFFHMAERKHND